MYTHWLYPIRQVIRLEEQEELISSNKEGLEPSMTERIPQPNKAPQEVSAALVEGAENNKRHQGIDGPLSQPSSVSARVWTPRFIVVFFLLLVGGLSAESLLTEGWLNGWYKAEWVLLAHIVLILGSLIALLLHVRSRWMRMGSILGCVWAMFTFAGLIVSLLNVNARLEITVQLQAAMSSALLGAYICLSTNHISSRHWDNWFFGLTPLVGIVAIIALYINLGGNAHPFRELANSASTVILYLCIFIWWLRPSCWRHQPCPTLLFGAVPAIMLIVPLVKTPYPDTYFFFSQVELLFFLLGVMRVLQGEKQFVGAVLHKTGYFTSPLRRI